MEIRQIENYQALCNRINKMITDFGMYPLMPEGDWSIKFIQDVFSFNPLFVLEDFKKNIWDVLLEKTDYKYSEAELMPIINETYTKREKELKAGVLNRIITNFKREIDSSSFNHKYDSYHRLRRDVTPIFYYAYSIFYISKELQSASGMLVARLALKALELIRCERGTAPFDSIKHTGQMLSLSEFSAELDVYNKLKSMIEDEIRNSGDDDIKQELDKIIAEEAMQEKGCYIATCVYGSYDCPQVWTLRRYRDIILGTTRLGRSFIRTYYALSPNLVKWFGCTKWFKRICKNMLDPFVKNLNSHGIDNSPYED